MLGESHNHTCTRAHTHTRTSTQNFLNGVKAGMASRGEDNGAMDAVVSITRTCKPGAHRPTLLLVRNASHTDIIPIHNPLLSFPFTNPPAYASNLSLASALIHARTG